MRSLAYSRQILAALALLVPLASSAAETDTTRAMRLAREATAAAQAGDNGDYLAKMEQAVALRPDFPRMQVNLAAAQLAAGRPAAALATLEQLAKLGLNSPVEKSPDFAALRGRKDFEAVVKKLAANAHPRGDGEIVFSLREVTGLIEGIAWRAKTGEFYFGDVNARAVWVRGKDEILRRLTPEGDELFGVFGLVLKVARESDLEGDDAGALEEDGDGCDTEGGGAAEGIISQKRRLRSFLRARNLKPLGGRSANSGVLPIS